MNRLFNLTDGFGILNSWAILNCIKLTLRRIEGEENVCCRSNIEEYECCRIWTEGYNSPSTRKSYKLHLLLFCRYHKTDPDSLIRLDPEQVKAMVLNYILHLKKIAKQTSGKARYGEISVNSIKTYLAGVQSFLQFNDVIINWKKIARFYPEQVTNDLRAYTREEISKLLSVADVRDRCIILLMASTGMRVGGIKSLKLKHLIRLPHESNIGLVTVYAESRKDRYKALMTPECLAAIDEYIECRKSSMKR